MTKLSEGKQIADDSELFFMAENSEKFHELACLNRSNKMISKWQQIFCFLGCTWENFYFSTDMAEHYFEWSENINENFYKQYWIPQNNNTVKTAYYFIFLKHFI